MDKINALIRAGANTAMTDRELFQKEIARWKKSTARKNQITGEHYYRGKHDILDRTRTVIGRDGRLQEVRNLPNNKIVDNQYRKMVDQKTNYLLGKPLTFDVDDEAYEAALRGIFDKRFHRLFQNIGEDSLNCGIGWLYVYYDDGGNFKFRRFAPYEILPFWKDEEHTILDCAARVYEVEAYEGQDLTVVEKVEIYRASGIERYVLSDGVLIDDVENPSSDYFTVKSAGGAKGYNWERIPIIPFKSNDEEIPLICKVKSLQDALNAALSDFQNNMQEDSRNTILIIKNYDGENLADFRYNLAQFGAVKVKTVDGSEGGVDALQIEVNSENYRILLELLKKAMIENAMGYDAKDDRLAGNPNQMNIQSMYSDIDLDANGMETEYQASFEDLLFFVNAHLANTGQGDFTKAEAGVIFNRDMLFSEAEAMGTLYQGGVRISNETLLSQVPFIDDVKKELERLDNEKQEGADEYGDALPDQNSAQRE
jgi:SPP1 family phage portal protein